MRDMGLDEAIRAGGGVGALARKIGISQPSISNWPRVPAERVLAVEAATGIDRAILRPDLYAQAPSRPATSMRSMPRARGNMRCCRCCWRARPLPICSVASRRSRAMRAALGVAHAALAQAARGASEERVAREFFDLFIGLGRGECLPYGSYYLTGFLHERPLARLRQDLVAPANRARARSGGAGRSRRDPVRDHGRARRPGTAGAAGCRSRAVRGASGALDGAVLRGPGTGASGGILSQRRNARPGVHARFESEGLRAHAA